MYKQNIGVVIADKDPELYTIVVKFKNGKEFNFHHVELKFSPDYIQIDNMFFFIKTVKYTEILLEK
jgi:hypothetical protein